MAKRNKEEATDTTTQDVPAVDPVDYVDPRAEYDRLLAEIAAQTKLVPFNEVKSINNGNGPSTPAGEVLYKLRVQKREAFLKLA